MKEVKTILSNSEYEIVLVEASNFFDAEPILGSREAERFEILICLIESYEDKY
jgi:HTH-type transcriptional regulator/antitoxin HigA